MGRLKLVCLMMLISCTSFSFDSNPFKKELGSLNRREKMPIGMNLYAVGPVGGISASLDAFITPKFAFEAVAGFRNFEFDHAFSLGMRYHFFGKTFLSLTPYVGLYTVFNHNGTTLQNQGLYIPFGIHKIKRKQWSWSVEGAYQRTNFFTNHFTVGVRLGYRFEKKKR